MEFVLPVFLFAMSAGITPGPNNVMVLSSGLNFGVRRSIPHIFGIGIGFPLMFILVGLSLGAIFERYLILHEMIKVLGLSYLLYLAWRIATTVPTSLELNKSRPLSFSQAVLFQWVNPKAWVIVTGSIATFTSVDGNVYLQIFLMTLIFIIVSFLTSSSWLFFGAWLKRFMTSPRHQRVFNISMAALLVLSFSPVAYDLINRYLLN